MFFFEKLRVKAGGKVCLKKISPSENFGWIDTEKIQERLQKNSKKLLELQYKLYAENRQSLLIVLQAMDAGGKDGVINHVLCTMNPQGCRSQSFKVPTALEAAHDFLWREHMVAPHNGEVVIFNRSHYEYVLIQRVHGMIDGKQLKKRFDYINDFERILHDNHTTIVKFFLHISKEEQLKRFGERLDDPAKHWKISENDYKEREYWDAYMNAFEDTISHCSSEIAPWFIIPANDKLFRNLAVSEILVDTLENMKPVIPRATIDVNEIRRLYHRDVLAEQNGENPVPAAAPVASDSPPERGKIKKHKKDSKRKKNKK